MPCSCVLVSPWCPGFFFFLFFLYTSCILSVSLIPACLGSRGPCRAGLQEAWGSEAGRRVGRRVSAFVTGDKAGWLLVPRVGCGVSP